LKRSTTNYHYYFLLPISPHAPTTYVHNMILYTDSFKRLLAAINNMISSSYIIGRNSAIIRFYKARRCTYNGNDFQVYVFDDINIRINIVQTPQTRLTSVDGREI